MLGTASRRIAQPGTASVIIRLNAAGRRAIARRPPARLTLRTRFTDVAGRRAERATAIRLIR